MKIVALCLVTLACSSSAPPDARDAGEVLRIARGVCQRFLAATEAIPAPRPAPATGGTGGVVTVSEDTHEFGGAP